MSKSLTQPWYMKKGYTDSTLGKQLYPLNGSLKIDPLNYTNFYASDGQIQSMFLFAVAVAGKPSRITAEKINSLLDDIEVDQQDDYAPDEIRRMGPLEYLMYLEHEPFIEMIKERKLGKYNTWLKLWRWFNDCKIRQKASNASSFSISDFLVTASIQSLERIPGVKYKTSRFFVLHSRSNANCVPLDTHILRFLRDRGVPCVPNVTPGSRQMYLGLEKIAVEALKSLGYSTLAKADLETWKSYSNGFRQFFREGDSTPEMV